MSVIYELLLFPVVFFCGFVVTIEACYASSMTLSFLLLFANKARKYGIDAYSRKVRGEKKLPLLSGSSCPVGVVAGLYLSLI